MYDSIHLSLCFKKIRALKCIELLNGEDSGKKAATLAAALLAAIIISGSRFCIAAGKSRE
jgi:hypothetical protein